MRLARVFPLMPMESVAGFLTNRTRVSANELRVVCESHRVNTSNTMEGSFELRESFSVRPAHMFAGVLEGMSKSTRKTGALKFKGPALASIRLCSLDINAPSAVFILANAHPCLEEHVVRNVRTHVDAMGMKVCVVFFLIRVPTAEFIAPKKEKLRRRDPQLCRHFLDTSSHVLIEIPDLFR